MTIDATQGIRDTSPILLGPDDITSRFGGDENAMIAALMLGHARDVREGARVARAAEEKNIEAQENLQVQAMHDQADDLRTAGTIEGITEIGAGVLEVGAGEITMTGETFPSGELKPAFSGEALTLKAFGEIGKGTGTMVASYYKGESQDADANGTAAGHHAQAAIRRLDDIKDLEKDARDLARTAVDFYRDQTRAKADADHAALFLRG
jgi:hypothetical protein